jgi:pentose-5-phosphate-3-epimerase
MVEIIPAILDKTYNEMKDHVESVLGLAKIVQIDFCDGIFVPSKTWPYASGVDEEGNLTDLHFQKIINEEEGMPFWEEIDYELHFMVKDGSKFFSTFLKLGPKRVLFQIEEESDLNEFKEFIEAIDPYVRETVQIGLAITTSTPIETLSPFIDYLDFVQCMGIEKVGLQGLPFDEKVFNHIASLRKNYPELIIAVDGSVNKDTAPRLVEAGVTRLVIGSALLKSENISETFYEFQNLK